MSKVPRLDAPTSGAILIASVAPVALKFMDPVDFAGFPLTCTCWTLAWNKHCPPRLRLRGTSKPRAVRRRDFPSGLRLEVVLHPRIQFKGHARKFRRGPSGHLDMYAEEVYPSPSRFQLDQLRFLRSLEVVSVDGFDANSCAVIARDLLFLESLSVSHCKNLWSRALSHLTKARRLGSLSLFHMPLLWYELPILSAMACLRELKILDLLRSSLWTVKLLALLPQVTKFEGPIFGPHFFDNVDKLEGRVLPLMHAHFVVTSQTGDLRCSSLILATS